VIVLTNGAADGKPDDAVVRASALIPATCLTSGYRPDAHCPQTSHRPVRPACPASVSWRDGHAVPGRRSFPVRSSTGHSPGDLEFGTIRRSKTRRVAWLDWHDLIASRPLYGRSWLEVPGVINTWAELMLNHWKNDGTGRAWLRPYAGKPPPAHLASLDLVLKTQRWRPRRMEGRVHRFLELRSAAPHHFAAFMARQSAPDIPAVKRGLLDGRPPKSPTRADLPHV